jgi:hypothetical protein
MSASEQSGDRAPLVNEILTLLSGMSLAFSWNAALGNAYGPSVRLRRKSSPYFERAIQEGKGRLSA